jgi:hypothetical protein
MNDRRTPNEIKEQAIMCFKQMARPKYDEGQAKAEASGGHTNLDEHPALITEARFEVLDLWFYLDSLNQQMDQKDQKIDRLELELERWKEMAQR